MEKHTKHILILLYAIVSLSLALLLANLKMSYDIYDKTKSIYDKTDSIFTDGHDVLTNQMPTVLRGLSFMQGVETGKAQERLARVESYIELNSSKI